MPPNYLYIITIVKDVFKDYKYGCVNSHFSVKYDIILNMYCE
jgi:hypothetical protein